MLDRLRNESDPWDILVIGGGATGLSVAMDAAARGYRTALIEQGDFATATSSRSTKLIHGGLRYLQQGRLWSGPRIAARTRAAAAQCAAFSAAAAIHRA